MRLSMACGSTGSIRVWSMLVGVTSITSLFTYATANPPTISTTSGKLQGVDQDGVMSFKGIRFGQAPVDELRWAAPLPFSSSELVNATELGPSCFQQFARPFSEELFNNPQNPPVEDEDCLFLNVWAPSGSTQQGELKPVVVWIYGGSLAFGTGSLPLYDGTSIAKNQDIVIVTFNYRTNVFGFPGSEDLPIEGNNLGFLDQELVFAWVQQNIANFGGDPDQVTIMGQSAGGLSVASALIRHPKNPPFRAGILFSGSVQDIVPAPSDFASFDELAAGVGCNQTAGAERLSCLKALPGTTIRAFTNGPGAALSFRPVYLLLLSPALSSVTLFADNFNRIRSQQTARVPIFLGHTQDDGTVFTIGQTNLTEFLNSNGVPPAVSPALVRSLYPGLDDEQVIAASVRDLAAGCPASLWAAGYVQSGISSVFRYEYGAVFPDLQLFPNAGAWHSSELQELFGTFNTSTATPNEATLSATFQTIIANFIKNPNESPAPNWLQYVLPGSDTQTLAKLAYQGNVELDNVVMPVQSDSVDGPCALWNRFLDFD
ncbi:alpha/beta-hydrolase [Dendrothele bispora CBS 962.96]|uniref:Carboxylic ester hydrolase n=1 Tax=Dendrothele bispora (strain CBS 962.96) TaxID=1314807 RepID=A0A4S8KVK2_DENBC|nr:alpha/beta-hydrolase [Dendrothele bispora CBS 962.96]